MSNTSSQEYDVVFLLGAGASRPAGIPTTKEFVQEFEKALLRESNHLVPAFAQLRAQMQSWVDPLQDVLLDIELVYDTLVRLSTKGVSFLDDTAKSSVQGVTQVDCIELRTRLESFIRDTAYATSANVDYLRPLLYFADGKRPLEVYSTNYDVLVEQVCDEGQIRWEDGFSVHWDPSMFNRKGVQVRIHKLHGSVLWFRDSYGNYIRTTARLDPGSSSGPALFSGDCESLLLYPAGKAAFELPYIENLVRFQTRLSGAKGSRVLLCAIGYSFRDPHLLQVVQDAARVNNSLRVVIVDPQAESIFQNRLGVVRDKDGIRRPSPLANRVFRVCEPVRATLLQRLKGYTLPTYKEALNREESAYVARARSPHSANWEGECGQAATQFRAIGDLGSYYRLREFLRWKPSASTNPVDAFVEGMREWATCIGSSIAVPPQRRLKDELQAAARKVFGDVRVVGASRDEFKVKLRREDPKYVVERFKELCGDVEEWAGAVGRDSANEKALRSAHNMCRSLLWLAEAGLVERYEDGSLRDVFAPCTSAIRDIANACRQDINKREALDRALTESVESIARALGTEGEDLALKYSAAIPLLR